MHDPYRERYTSARDRQKVRAGVWYPDSKVLWTEWREENARTRLEKYDDDRAEILEQLEDAKAASTPDKDRVAALQSDLDELDKQKEDDERYLEKLSEASLDEVPAVIRPIGDVVDSRLSEAHESGDISKLDLEIRRVVECVYKARMDEDGEWVLDGGQPLPSIPVYELPGDRDYLYEDVHVAGGDLWWLKRITRTYCIEAITQLVNDEGK